MQQLLQLPQREHPQLIFLLKYNPSPPILTFPRREKKKESSSLSAFYVTQIHRSTLTAPQPPHVSPISLSLHYLARNITPHQSSTLRSPNARSPGLPPPARGVTHVQRLSSRPIPTSTGWSPPVGWGGLGWAGVGSAPPRLPHPPRRRHEGEGGPEASPTAPPLPGGALPCPSQGREEEAG